jgi:hypothetical protein
MEGMGIDDDHKQFEKRNLTTRSVYSALHRGYVVLNRNQDSWTYLSQLPRYPSFGHKTANFRTSINTKMF